MKRRTFLRMLGLAPVAAAVPAMALPRPENVKNIVTGESGPEAVYPFVHKDGTTFFKQANIEQINIGTMRSSNGKTVIESLDGGDAVLRLHQ